MWLLGAEATASREGTGAEKSHSEVLGHWHREERPLGQEGLTIRLLRRSVELLGAMNPNISLPMEKLKPCGGQNFPKNSADGLALRTGCHKAKCWVLLSLLVNSTRNRSHCSLTKYLGVL